MLQQVGHHVRRCACQEQAPGSRPTGGCGGSAPRSAPTPGTWRAPAHLHGERAGRRELPLRFRQLLFCARLAEARRGRVARVVAERLQHLHEEPQVVRAALRGAARASAARALRPFCRCRSGRQGPDHCRALALPDVTSERAHCRREQQARTRCSPTHDAGAQPGVRGRPAAQAGARKRRAWEGALRALCSASWLCAARACASAAAARSSSRRTSASRPCAARGGGWRGRGTGQHAPGALIKYVQRQAAGWPGASHWTQTAGRGSRSTCGAAKLRGAKKAW